MGPDSAASGVIGSARVDVQDHLVAIACSPRSRPRGESGLGQQPERVGAALGRLISSDIAGRSALDAIAEQPVGRGLEGTLHHRAHLGREATADHDHPVVVHPHGELPIEVSHLRVPGLFLAIHAAPAANQAFDMGRCAGQGEVEQRTLVPGSGHAGEGTDLGVGDLARLASTR